MKYFFNMGIDALQPKPESAPQFEPKARPSEITQLMAILNFTEQGDALLGKESLRKMETAGFMRREINNQIAYWTANSMTPERIGDPEKAMETMTKLRGFLDRLMQTGTLQRSEILDYQKSIDELHSQYLKESISRNPKK